MLPMRGEKPQNRPLSKLNTGRLALRAMLPVTRLDVFIHDLVLEQKATVTSHYNTEMEQ